MANSKEVNVSGLDLDDEPIVIPQKLAADKSFEKIASVNSKRSEVEE
jgi:hypothetical protein